VCVCVCVVSSRSICSFVCVQGGIAEWLEFLSQGA